MTLLELSARVPSSYRPFFAGWDRQDRLPENTTTIHHPRGHVKKITLGANQPDVNTEDLLLNENTDAERIMPTGHAWIVNYTDGTTEPGSSGAPMFNQNQRIIGTNSARDGDFTGDDFCEQPKFYGRFTRGWDLGLNTFLDPIGTNPPEIQGISPRGWRHTQISNPNAPNSRKVKSKLRSIAVGLGNQTFYRGNNDHIQVLWQPAQATTNTPFTHGNLGGNNPPNSQKASGDIAVGLGNQIFYRGNNGHVHTYFWANGNWNHDELGGNNPPNNRKVSNKAGSLVVGGNNQVFYRGTDDKMQTYYWDAATSSWLHGYLNQNAPANEDVGGALDVHESTNRVFYRGASDGKIHLYEWQSGAGWVHSVLAPNHQVSTEEAAVEVSATGSVYFRGTDDKIQVLYPTNGSWGHGWPGGWNAPNGFNVAGDFTVGTGSVYYQGADGKMHVWFWANGSWHHDWLETSWQAPFIHSPNGDIAVGSSATADVVFYKGNDDRMRRYHWENDVIKSANSNEDDYYSMTAVTPSPTIPTIDYNNTLLSLSVRPNPIQQRGVIEIHSQDAEQVQLFLFNSLGQIMLEQSVNVQEGLNTLPLPMQDLQSGIYYLNIVEQNGSKLSTTVMKM